MSMISYKYQPVTMGRLLNLIRWFQNQLQLRDWTIKIDLSICMPKEFKPGDDDSYEALCNINKDTLTALIWLPLPRFAERNDNPIEAVIHELCHVMIEARGMDGEDEALVRTISPMLYRLWCRENKIKIAMNKPAGGP